MSHRTSTLVVFGDSLSDNGNLFALTGFPLPPRWEGRSSNGPVYAEQLANFLHMNLDDRAFAGAEASDASPPVIVNPPAVVEVPVPVPGEATYIGRRYPWYTGGATAKAVTTAAAAPCTCLTKEYLQDGSVLFKDLCTKEAAILTVEEMRAKM